jgi:hypothetical protein
MSHPAAFISAFWTYFSILRNEDLSCGVYAEHLPFLLLAPFRSGFAQRLALPVSSTLRLLKLAGLNRRFSVVEELKAVAATNLQRATHLHTAVLQKAFSGRI